MASTSKALANMVEPFKEYLRNNPEFRQSAEETIQNAGDSCLVLERVPNGKAKRERTIRLRFSDSEGNRRSLSYRTAYHYIFTGRMVATMPSPTCEIGCCHPGHQIVTDDGTGVTSAQRAVDVNRRALEAIMTKRQEEHQPAA